MRYAMAIDTKKCVGCSDCVVACQLENKVPIGYCRDWIVETTTGTYPNLELEFRGCEPVLFNMARYPLVSFEKLHAGSTFPLENGGPVCLGWEIHSARIRSASPYFSKAR